MCVCVFEQTVILKNKIQCFYKILSIFYQNKHYNLTYYLRNYAFYKKQLRNSSTVTNCFAQECGCNYC